VSIRDRNNSVGEMEVKKNWVKGTENKKEACGWVEKKRISKQKMGGKGGYIRSVSKRR